VTARLGTSLKVNFKGMAKPYALCGLRVNERPCPAPKLYVITIHTTKAASQTYSIHCIN